MPGGITEDIVYIDLGRGTSFSLAWLVADGNSSKNGPARLIGSRFQEREGGLYLLYLIKLFLC